MQATGKQIKEAFLKARSQCGYDYRLLSNNCQTFARLFMLALGAKHERQLMHP
ncbi:hypothetical protein [Massilia sp. Leaf139]|uniref:hypothetical protein n=1 Tax=Massilia sp. Leaf139 TaxID=1736272 RepID=UPI000A8AB8D6|nr:hypothetical protein [Massilia sp. Leaf139]